MATADLLCNSRDGPARAPNRVDFGYRALRPLYIFLNWWRRLLAPKHGESDNPYLDFITDDIVKAFAVLGDPEAHIAKLGALQAAGITQFNIYLDSGHEEKIIADYAEQIIPAFHS